jgi:hypothetical protein
MNLEEINQRVNELQEALRLDTDMRKTIFTVGQRICINQEMASLLDIKKYLQQEKPLTEVFQYKVPPEIETILKRIKC